MLALRKGRLKGCATDTPLSRAKARAGSSMAVLANRYGSRPAAEEGQAGSNVGGGRVHTQQDRTQQRVYQLRDVTVSHGINHFGCTNSAACLTLQHPQQAAAQAAAGQRIVHRNERRRCAECGQC